MIKLLVILDAGHCAQTPGKRSPDGRLREYKYCREILALIEKKLDALGIEHYNCHPEESYAAGAKDDSKDLVVRTNRINAKVAEYSKKGYQSILISIHNNAAGAGSWSNASGWTPWVYTTASDKSKTFAKLLYNQAINAQLKGNRSIPSCMYYTANFWILRKSNCPAVLTENLFQDNKRDVDYLLTDSGKNTIAEIHIKGIQEYIKTMHI